MPWEVLGRCACITAPRLLACAHPSDARLASPGPVKGSVVDEMMARLAPAMVRACSSSRRQSRSKRSDCSATVSRASHAGLLTRSSLPRRTCPRCLSRIYMHARRRRLDRVSSPRPPSARQAPKLNKGSPLPRQRPQVCSCATTTSLAPRTRTTTTTTTTTTKDNNDGDDDCIDTINDHRTLHHLALLTRPSLSDLTPP
jgi:hypothetical protein